MHRALLVGLGTGVGVDAPDSSDIAAAGAALLDGMSEEERHTPFTGELAPDPDGGGIDDDLEPTPAEAATDVGEPIVRNDGAEWNEETERWTLDGKFVAGDPPEGWEPPAAPAKPAADPKAAAKPAAGEPKAVKVVLPALAERGEEDIEVEVDEEIAQRIQRLKNDGIRAKEYATKRADLDAREAALSAYDQELQVDPIGFHLNKMPPEQQVIVARALLVDHLDALMPDIERLRDPAERLAAVRELQQGLKQSGDRLQQQRAIQTTVRAVIRATEALVPEGTDDATFNDFMADARRDLARAAEQNERVTPETAKQILARRMKLYGFDAQRPAARKAPAAKPVPPAARPISDRARAIADRRPAPAAAAVVVDPSRIRRTQGARSAASRIASPGAGAAPTQTPTLPPEAEQDIASVGRYMRSKGMLSETWRPAGE